MATYIQALRQALHEEMDRDGGVCVFGEDVAAGGVFGVTQGLAAAFGPERVRNTPISEATIVGLAVGAAATGLRPVVEVMFIDFITLAMDPIVNQAAKLRFMSGGQLKVPMVLRTQNGAMGGMAAQHSQCLEAWLTHVPGLKVVAPATPADALGLLKAAIRDDNAVICVEHKRLYLSRGDLPEIGAPFPLGVAAIRRTGRDVTLVAYGSGVSLALAAAAQLAADGVSAEVVDLRTLVPLDMETVTGSIRKTNRAVVVHEAVTSGGFGAELVARIQAEAFSYLDAPVARVGAAFAPIPFHPVLEAAVLPSADKIVTAVRALGN